MKYITYLIVLFLCSGHAFAQSFSSTLVGSNVVLGGEVISDETEMAFATFELITDPQDDSLTQLIYEINLDSFDIDGTRTADLGDDVTAIHLHTLTECVQPTCIAGDSAGTKHVLNIFGSPRQDDADIQIEIGSSTIRGIWDPSDVNSLSPAPGQDPNDFLSELAEGNLFLMVHTRQLPSGAVGGFIVPEPSSATLALVAFGLLGLMRRRHRLMARGE